MIGDDRGKDEIAAQSLLNKHINVEKAVANFKEDIDELHNRSEQLVAAEHPERYDRFLSSIFCGYSTLAYFCAYLYACH